MAKHAVGAPKKYTDDIIRAEAKALLQYVDKTKVPMLKEFCAKRGYCSETISKIFELNPDFSQALKIAKDLMEVKWARLGLKCKNQAFVIFSMKNMFGWRDKTEVEHGMSEDLTEKFKDITFAQVKEKLSAFCNGPK